METFTNHACERPRCSSHSMDSTAARDANAPSQMVLIGVAGRQFAANEIAAQSAIQQCGGILDPIGLGCQRRGSEDRSGSNPEVELADADFRFSPRGP